MTRNTRSTTMGRVSAPAPCDRPGACPTRLERGEMAERTCCVDGCDQPARLYKPACSMHQTRMDRKGAYGPVGRLRPPSGLPCSVEGCSSPTHAQGLCGVHYRRRLTGRPLDVPVKPKGRAPLNVRVWRYVDKCGPVPDYAPHLGACWIWTGTVDRHGYGSIGVGGRSAGNTGAHRAAYESSIGPVPEGLELDHLCRVPACVNPTHLEPVTRSENIARGIGPATTAARAAARTHCKWGHRYTPENTYIRPNGARSCRICGRSYRRRRGLT